MSTTNAPLATNRQKRKRAIISYAQLDQLADILSDNEDVAGIPCDELSDDDSDNDDRTYSRHKVRAGHECEQDALLTDQPRKLPRRPQSERKRGTPVLVSLQKKDLSPSWSYRQSSVT